MGARGGSDFTGAYQHDGLGTITSRVWQERLHWTCGVLSGVAEVFDAAKRSMRIELAASGSVVEFDFPEPGSARGVTADGARFGRVQPRGR